jgi:hypothetical protein
MPHRIKPWRSDSSADKGKRKEKKNSKFNSTDINNEAGIIEENETQNMEPGIVLTINIGVDW